MTYENIKSIILTILVVTSVVLTWNLWTYQPNYETMEKSNTVQEVYLSEQRDIEQMIQPDKIIYHVKDEHYGTTNSADITQTLEEMVRWNFFDLENISDEIENIPDFVHGNGNVEIIFPDTVPMELYKNILHIEDKKVPNFQFNRIIIDVENNTKDHGNIYFVHYGNMKSHQVFVSHIKTDEMKKFENEFYRPANQLNRYFSYKVTDQRTIFLPENNMKLLNYQYFIDQLDPEQLKDALFNDPSYVQRNDEEDTVEYIDDSSMLTVNNDTLLLSYVNPAEETDIMVRSKDLLEKSIDFVNGHGGWAGLYKYSSVDEENQKVTFRLYNRNGYPIFNEQGLSQIVQVWGQNEIYKYTRPILTLDVPLTTETNEVTLHSGIEVVNYLKAKKGFKPELLKDITIGYKMSNDSKESQLMNLEPSWFYQYGNSWVQLKQNELGGNKDGLE
jgi:regulatory protein YycH of two-component signal transduction system YycFG